MPIYTKASYEVFSPSTYHHYFQSATTPGVGYRYLISKAVAKHCFSELYEGVARPAWYPTQLADLTNSVTRSKGGSPSSWYYTLNHADDYIQWTVPAAAAGVDTLVCNPLGLAAGGIFDVVKNPGVGEATLGEVNTYAATTNYALLVTLTGLDPLVAGDIIRFRWKSGNSANCSLQSFYGYDADGVCTHYNQQFALPDQTQIDGSSTGSVEYSYSVAPDGSPAKWTGGAAHQTAGASNCSQDNGVATWNPTTPVPGWNAGQFFLRWQADVDYDEAPTIIGTVDDTTRFGTRGYGASNLFTALVNLDVGSLYPFHTDSAKSYTLARFTPRGADFDITPTDDSSVDVPAADLQSVTGCIYSTTPLTQYLHARLRNMSHRPHSAWMYLTAEVSKMYLRIVPGAYLAGTTWGGSWYCEFRDRVKYQRGGGRAIMDSRVMKLRRF